MRGISKTEKGSQRDAGMVDEHVAETRDNGIVKPDDELFSMVCAMSSLGMPC